MVIKYKHLGFTLVEILVVLSLIGAISVFSVVEGPVQLQKARDAVRKQGIDQMKVAIEEYHTDTNCYPQTVPACKNSLVNGNLNILDRIPCDPKSKLSYTYVPEISECPKWFQLYANLEYTSDKIIDKVGCRYGCGPNCQFNYGAASSNQNLNPFCTENIPNPEPMPSSTPLPVIEQLQYVCTVNGLCEVYADPGLSGCPDIYLNDPLCQNACQIKENRCHDARGKQN